MSDPVPGLDQNSCCFVFTELISSFYTPRYTLASCPEFDVQQTWTRVGRDGDDRPRYAGPDRQQHGQERPEYGRDRPDYGRQRDDYDRERPEYIRVRADYGRERPDYGRERLEDRRTGEGRPVTIVSGLDVANRRGGPSSSDLRQGRGGADRPRPSQVGADRERQEHGQVMHIHGGVQVGEQAGERTAYAPHREHGQMLKIREQQRSERPGGSPGRQDRPYIIPDRPGAETRDRGPPPRGRALPESAGVGGGPKMSVSSPDGWSRLLPAREHHPSLPGPRGRPGLTDRIERPARRDQIGWQRDPQQQQQSGPPPNSV